MAHYRAGTKPPPIGYGSPVPETWLLISHAFNMDGRAASQTVTDKIPHLLARGVTPVVVSAVTGRRDAQLEHHQVLAPLPSGLRFDLRHWLGLRIRNRLLLRAAKSLVQLLLLPFYLAEKLLVPLDSHWSWFITARAAGAGIIRRQRPRLIYTSGGAASAHVAGWLLKRRFGLPWIAEVHDPMVWKDWSAGPIRYRWFLWVESLICRHADLAWWFTPTALARARERHPELGGRGRLLYPGANPPASAGAPYAKGPHFVLAHFGSLAKNRNLVEVLGALRRLLEAQPELRAVVRLRTYGGDWDEVSRAALADFPFPEVVENRGRLEADPATGRSGRERVLQAMRQADVLLLLHGEDSFCQEYFPSKLYEYLWMGRPILGVIHDNADLERLLREQGHPALAAGDAAALARELGELVRRWRDAGLPSREGPSPYPAEAAVARIVEWARALPAP
jgi:glycosyltransferase involved in cell wall biosynthesis